MFYSLPSFTCLSINMSFSLPLSIFSFMWFDSERVGSARSTCSKHAMHDWILFDFQPRYVEGISQMLRSYGYTRSWDWNKKEMNNFTDNRKKEHWELYLKKKNKKKVNWQTQNIKKIPGSLSQFEIQQNFLLEKTHTHKKKKNTL